MASRVESILGSVGETKKTSGMSRLLASSVSLPKACTKAFRSRLNPSAMIFW